MSIVFYVHTNFHWSKDLSYIYDRFHDWLYIMLKSLRLSIKIRFVYINKFSHNIQDQRLSVQIFIPNFLSPKLLNPHKLSSLEKNQSHSNLCPSQFSNLVYRTCSRIFRSFHNLFRNWSSNQSVHRAFRSAGLFEPNRKQLNVELFRPPGSIVPSPRAKKHRNH